MQIKIYIKLKKTFLQIIHFIFNLAKFFLFKIYINIFECYIDLKKFMQHLHLHFHYSSFLASEWAWHRGVVQAF
jgi:hypothetical protein